MSGDGPSPPSAEVLLALDADAWAGLLRPARAALRQVGPRLDDAAVDRLLALPASRLALGRGREQLAALLQRGAVWAAVEEHLPGDHPRPWEALEASASADARRSDEAQEALADARHELAVAEQRAARAEHRLRSARAERDAAQAARERDARRAGTAEEAAAAASVRADALAQELEVARAGLAEADAAVTRAVARERRRAAAGRGEDVAALREARREVHELRGQLARVRAELATRPVPPGAATGAATRPDVAVTHEAEPAGGRRGRPSLLPADLHPATVAASRWLLDAGRRLLVDGYNLTLTQRSDLDLAGQRRWLVDGLGVLAARRGVDALVVFDARGGTAARLRPRGGVTVRFTEAELTADDELVFEVASLPDDEPVVVVTDDRGLRDRLAAYRVDLLRTHDLLPLLR